MWKIAVLLACTTFVYGQDDPRYHRYPGYAPRTYRRPAYRQAIPDGDTATRTDRLNYIEDHSPKPYSFSYTAPDEGGVGSSSRTEVADGNGRVEGSYTLVNGEGYTRVVDYVSDEGGFRATVRTDEPGTSNQSPASINFLSTAPNVFSSGERRPELRNPVHHRRPTAYRAPAVVAEEPINVDQPIDQSVTGHPRVYRPANYYAPRYQQHTPSNYYSGHRRDAYYP